MAKASPTMIIPTHVATFNVASQNSISPYLKSATLQGPARGVIPTNVERIERDWEDCKYRNPYGCRNAIRRAPEPD